MGDNGVNAYCAAEGLPILLRIPMERAIAEGIARGESLIAIRPAYQNRPHCLRGLRRVLLRVPGAGYHDDAAARRAVVCRYHALRPPLPRAPLRRARENSGKLVTLVKQMARLRAFDAEADLLLVDGPPGIGCPVIAALSGADGALSVTEPTVSGAHDLERALGLAAHFNIPALVLLNKADLSPVQAEAIVAHCAAQSIPLVGRLPYDPTVTEAMVRGEPVTAGAGPVSAALREAWAFLRRQVFGAAP